MLLVEYICQYLIYSNLWCAFIQYLGISFLACKVVNLGIDGDDALFIKLALTCEYGLAFCCEQDVVIQRWDEQFAPPIEELRAQVYP